MAELSTDAGMPTPGKFPCHHDGCTLLERHPSLCVFANLSDNRGRRGSTHERTVASTVQAVQPAVKRKVAPPLKVPADGNQRGSSRPTPACALLVSSCTHNDPATMVPPQALNSMGAEGAPLDPNSIPFPDIGRGMWTLPDAAKGQPSGEPSGSGSRDGVICLYDGCEAASGDEEAPTEAASAAVRPRKRPGQHRPWGATKQHADGSPTSVDQHHAAPRRVCGAWVGQVVDVPMAEFEVRRVGTYSGVLL